MLIDEQIQLYEKRRVADSIRQPAMTELLKELQEALLRLDPPRSHPYTLTAANYLDLKDIPAYKAVCRGTKCKTNREYLYRILTWPRLVADINPVTRNWRKLRESVTEERAFTYLLKEQKQRGKWLPVSRYIGGYYSGLRNFTWWTTVEMPTTKTMCTAHHLGLLNNNVGTEALILRCRADFIREKSLTYIPSTIDAFFSNIFYATQDEADCGRAISVENPKQLRLGAEEFVSEPINIEESGMELCPLLLEDTHQVYLEDIFDSLIRFYTDLIELENT